MTEITAHRYIRILIVLIALLGLGLRSLIPVGYMPDFSGQGKGLFPIVICDGFERVADEHSEHAHMHHEHGGGKHSHGGLCPFGIGGIAISSLPEIAEDFYFAYDTAKAQIFVYHHIHSQFVFANASSRSPPFS